MTFLSLRLKLLSIKKTGKAHKFYKITRPSLITNGALKEVDEKPVNGLKPLTWKEIAIPILTSIYAFIFEEYENEVDPEKRVQVKIELVKSTSTIINMAVMEASKSGRPIEWE